MNILQPHPYDDRLKPGHLNSVIATMKEEGAATLRVVRICDLWQALEGCHRLQAASILMADEAFEFDVTPEIVEMDPEGLIDWDSFDFDRADFDGVETYGDLAQKLYKGNCACNLRAITF